MPTPRQELENLVEVFTPRIRDAFIAAIQDVTDNAILADVIEAIQTGDVEAAFRALGYSEAAMRPLTAELERAFEEGGVMTGRTFPRYLNTPSGRGIFRFNIRNSRAEAYLRDHSASLVSRIEDDVRNNLRNALVVGMQEGRNPRNVALDIVGRYDRQAGHRIGGVLGLSQQQETWARSARNRLMTLDERYFMLELRDKRSDSIVRRAIEEGRPLSEATINRLMTRYRDNALRWRGESIGRTEAMQSLSASEYEATKQAVEIGAVKESAVVREWDSAGDRRVRWSHKQLDGQKVGLNEPFVSPATGARMMFPGDTKLGAPAREVIMCRCRVKTVIDWLADVD